MAKLICVTPTSLNGYIADETGDFDWPAPDEEVHAFINDIVRPIGTYLATGSDCNHRLSPGSELRVIRSDSISGRL